MDIVVSGGADPDRPIKPGRPPRDRTQVLLTLLVVGVFVTAACAVFTAWNSWSERRDSRAVQCAYLEIGGGDIDDVGRIVAEAYDCDVEDD